MDFLDMLEGVDAGAPPTPYMRDLAARKLRVQQRQMAKARDRDWRLAMRQGMAPSRMMAEFGMGSGGGTGGENQAMAFAMMGRPDLAELSQKQWLVNQQDQLERWKANQQVAQQDRQIQAQFGMNSPAMMQALNMAEDSRANRANQAWEVARKIRQDTLEGQPSGIAMAAALKSGNWNAYPQMLKQLDLLRKRGMLPDLTPPPYPGMPSASMPSVPTLPSPPAAKEWTASDDMETLPPEVTGSVFLNEFLNRTSVTTPDEAKPYADMMRRRGVSSEVLIDKLKEIDPARFPFLKKVGGAMYYPEFRPLKYDPVGFVSRLLLKPFFPGEDPAATDARYRNIKKTNALLSALGG